MKAAAQNLRELTASPKAKDGGAEATSEVIRWVDDLFTLWVRGKVFSKCDLCDAYQQLPLTESKIVVITT